MGKTWLLRENGMDNGNSSPAYKSFQALSTRLSIFIPCSIQREKNCGEEGRFFPDVALRNDFGYLTRKGAVTPKKNQE